ncbi:MAG: hypothetical protein RTV31_04265 [Candidatus Thorarchaeota archaeon]
MAECYDQTSLEEFASTTDLAMEGIVEIPSAAMEARKATDTHSSKLQRTETTSKPILDKARVMTSDLDPMYTGDGRHEKGGTRKLKVVEEVHSTSPKT